MTLAEALLKAQLKDKDAVDARASRLTRTPKCMPAVCKPMWHEAGYCYMFGQNFAALCVTSAFVECLLRKALTFVEKRDGLPTANLRTFYAVIEHAEKTGVISPEDARFLQDFRKFVRNLVAHGNIDQVADSLLRVKQGTLYMDGEFRQVSDEELDWVREVTAPKRAAHSIKEYADKVVPEIGKWARRHSLAVWGPAAT